MNLWDGRTDSEGGNKRVKSRHRRKPERGATGITGGSPGDPVIRGDPTNSGIERNDVTGSAGNLGGSQADRREASPGADSIGGEGRRRIVPRPRSELSPEELNFTIEPGSEPQPLAARDGWKPILRLLNCSRFWSLRIVRPPRRKNRC